jgi:hypothetical protein
MSGPWAVENWWKDILKSCCLIAGLVVDYGHMVYEIHAPQDPFESWLFSMFVLDDHTQERMLSNTLFQGRKKRMNRSQINIFTGHLVDCSYDKSVVKSDIFTADGAAFIRT